MARQHRAAERFKSVSGGALVGLGLHILFGNLDRASAQFGHLLGTASTERLGVLPSAVLATSQAVQAYGLDHQGLVLGVLRMSVSFWPLLLVIVGTLLLQDILTDKAKALPGPAKYFQNNDGGCRFCCPSFDA